MSQQCAACVAVRGVEYVILHGPQQVNGSVWETQGPRVVFRSLVDGKSQEARTFSISAVASREARSRGRVTYVSVTPAAKAITFTSARRSGSARTGFISSRELVLQNLPSMLTSLKNDTEVFCI